MPELLAPKDAARAEKFLFYGEPKTGKTFAAGTAPDPIWVIAVGNIDELMTYFSPDFVKPYGDKQIFHDVVEESEEWKDSGSEGFDNLTKILNTGLARAEDPDDPFNFSTLVIDNATQIGNFAMYKAMEVNFGITSNKEFTALKRLRDNDIVIPGDNDWKSQMSLMGQFVNFLFRLKKHVVLITHEWKEETVDRKTKRRVINAVKPLFTGKQRTDIPGLFSNVWRFESTGQFFEAQTVGGTHKDNYSVIAGTRMGGILPKHYRNVNIEEAIEKLQEAAQKGRK